MPPNLALYTALHLYSHVVVTSLTKSGLRGKRFQGYIHKGPSSSYLWVALAKCDICLHFPSMIALPSITPQASRSISDHLCPFPRETARCSLGRPDSSLATVLAANLRGREAWMAFHEVSSFTACPSQSRWVDAGCNGRPGRSLNSLPDHSLGARAPQGRMKSFENIAAFTEIVNVLKFQADRGEVDVEKLEITVHFIRPIFNTHLEQLTLTDPLG